MTKPSRPPRNRPAIRIRFEPTPSGTSGTVALRRTSAAGGPRGQRALVCPFDRSNFAISELIVLTSPRSGVSWLSMATS